MHGHHAAPSSDVLSSLFRLLQTRGITCIQANNGSAFEALIGDGQVVVQLAVDKSRSVCLSVAHGEVDVAIIGGHVPEDLKDVLQACCP